MVKCLCFVKELIALMSAVQIEFILEGNGLKSKAMYKLLINGASVSALCSI